MQPYTLPADVGWDEIKGFYEEEIKEDWKAETQLTQESEALKTVDWTRGSLASEQGLAIGYGPALLDKPPFLMIVLFSE